MEAQDLLRSGSGKYECNSCRRVFTYRKNLEKHIVACKVDSTIAVRMEVQEIILKDTVHCCEDIKEEFNIPNDEAVAETLETVSSIAKLTELSIEGEINNKETQSSISCPNEGDFSTVKNYDDSVLSSEQLKDCTIEMAKRTHDCHTTRKDVTVHRKRRRKRYECITCNRAFTTPLLLKDHMDRHLGIKPHKCSICDLCYATQFELKQHLTRDHCNTKPSMCSFFLPYRCTICELTFSSPSQLQIHHNRHLGIKPHKCTICNHGFYTFYELKRHSKIHRKGELTEAKTNSQMHERAKTNSDYDTNRPQKNPAKMVPILSKGLKDASLQQRHFETATHPFDSVLIEDQQDDEKEDLLPGPNNYGKQFNKNLFTTSADKNEIIGSLDDGEVMTLIGNEANQVDASSKLEHKLLSNSMSGEAIALTPCEENRQNVEISYKCDKCGKIFATNYLLNTHTLREHLNSRTHKCFLCATELPNIRDLEKHARAKHLQRDSYKCTACAQTFKQPAGIKTHVGSSHAKRKSKAMQGCNHCEATFASLPELLHHLKEHVLYKCTSCGAAFETFTLLNHHMENHRDRTSANNAYRQPRITIMSDLTEAQKQQTQLPDDMNGHLSIKPHKCTSCERCYTTRLELKKHWNNTHSKNRPYGCNYCSASFENTDQLKVHRYIHFEIKPYNCNICKKGFKHHSNLQDHIKRHKGLLPLKCTTCEKRFATRYHLEAHKKRHLAVKPHTCVTCGYGFRTNFELKRHLKSHIRRSRYVESKTHLGSTDSSDNDANAQQKTPADVEPVLNKSFHDTSLQRCNLQTATNSLNVVLMEDQQETVQPDENGKQINQNLFLNRNSPQANADRNEIISSLEDREFMSLTDDEAFQVKSEAKEVLLSTSNSTSNDAMVPISVYKSPHYNSSESKEVETMLLCDANVVLLKDDQLITYAVGEDMNLNLKGVKISSEPNSPRDETSVLELPDVNAGFYDLDEADKLIFASSQPQVTDITELTDDQKQKTQSLESWTDRAIKMENQNDTPVHKVNCPHSHAENPNTGEVQFARNNLDVEFLIDEEEKPSENSSSGREVQCIQEPTPKERNKRKAHKCEMCDEIFGSSSLLKKHRDRHVESKAFECHICNKNGFACELSFKNHIKRHEKIYKCDQCGASYGSAAQLKIHTGQHLGIQLYECNICKNTFTWPSSLKKHMNKHMGLRHKCTLCDRTFTDIGSLQAHNKRHLGIRPYKCTNCELAFVSSYELKQHMSKHTKKGHVKPQKIIQDILKHKCTSCRKGFPTFEELKAHLESHKETEPYACNDENASKSNTKNNTAEVKPLYSESLGDASQQNVNVPNTLDIVFVEDQQGVLSHIQDTEIVDELKDLLTGNEGKHLHAHHSLKDSTSWVKIGPKEPIFKDSLGANIILSKETLHTLGSPDKPIVLQGQAAVFEEKNINQPEKENNLLLSSSQPLIKAQSEITKELNNITLSYNEFHDESLDDPKETTQASFQFEVKYDVSEKKELESPNPTTLNLRKHRLNSQNEEVQNTLGCDFCDASFAKSSLLEDHRNRHLEAKKLQCHICLKSYKNRKVLHNHLVTHTSIFKCEHCDRRFTGAFHLRNHIRMHLPKKKSEIGKVIVDQEITAMQKGNAPEICKDGDAEVKATNHPQNASDSETDEEKDLEFLSDKETDSQSNAHSRVKKRK